MKHETLYRSAHRRWLAFGQDPDRPEQIIDTNQFVVIDGEEALLIDPGGSEVFPAMLGALTGRVDPKMIRYMFLSHQDPDVSSSLPLWRSIVPGEISIFVSWLWTGFVSHFDPQATFQPIPDEGMDLRFTSGRSLKFIPAHYLHSSGNFSLYDPEAKVLFSGDIGAALVPESAKTSLFVEDFEAHLPYMEGFHQRWMPSEEAKQSWVRRVRGLEIDVLAPQHGLLFKGKNVGRFLDWFSALKIGVAADPTPQPV